MKVNPFIVVGGLFCFLTATVSLAEPRLQIVHTEVVDGRVLLDVNVDGDGLDQNLFIQKDGEDKEFSFTEVTPIPSNFWVLMDTSSSCRSRSLDIQLASLLHALKKRTSQDSTLSLISYSRNSLEVHRNHKGIHEGNLGEVSCESTKHSGSYERALLHLLKTKQKSDLPTAVWVFSSGNIRLSKDVLKKLKTESLNLHIVVYNPSVAREVSPILREYQQQLGPQKFRFSVSAKVLKIPEQQMRLAFDAPFSFQGKGVTLRTGYGAGENRVLSSPFKVKIPDSAFKTFWFRYGRVLTASLCLLVLGFLVYKLVKRYKQYHCRSCQALLRKGSTQCLFCREPGDVYFVGEFNYTDPRKFGKTDIKPLEKRRVEIGTHRKSAIPIRRVKGSKKRCYATLEVRDDENGRSFRLLRSPSAPQGSVRVNGDEVDSIRFLGSGDRIEVMNQSFGLYVEEARA